MTKDYKLKYHEINWNDETERSIISRCPYADKQGTVTPISKDVFDILKESVQADETEFANEKLYSSPFENFKCPICKSKFPIDIKKLLDGKPIHCPGCNFEISDTKFIEDLKKSLNIL